MPTTATFALLLPVSSSNSAPSVTSQLRILNHTAVVPLTWVFQLASSEAICVPRAWSSGAIHLIVDTSCSSAVRSSQVIDSREPAPPAAPKLWLELLVTISTLVPRVANTSLTAACAP